MPLEKPTQVDAVGIDKTSGKAVLSILDGWDWTDSRRHILALQAKINAYLVFVEKGQLAAAYPDAKGKDIVIEVVTRYPMPPEGLDHLKKVETSVAKWKIEVRTRHAPGKAA
jgi:hypothetical protein